MRRLLSLLTIAAAFAVPVAVFVSPALAVTPPSCLGSSGSTYIGFEQYHTVVLNGTVNADITDYGNVINGPSGSNVRGEVRIDNDVYPETSSGAAYIEAGVETTASGDRLFIAYKSNGGTEQFIDEGAASEGTTYNAQVKYTAVSGDNFTFVATINGHSATETIVSGLGFSYTEEMENQQIGGGSCNDVNTQFASHSPSNIVASPKKEDNNNGNAANTTLFDELYYTATQHFAAYSPWDTGGSCNPGPCSPAP